MIFIIIVSLPNICQALKIIKTQPHNTAYFTQGLVFDQNYLYESIGQYGQSKIIKYDAKSKQSVQQKKLPKQYFAEGITIWGDKLYVLTWRSKTGFVLNKKTLQTIETFRYTTQGWGLTHNKTHLIISDGSEHLFFIDPMNYHIMKILAVKYNKQSIKNINELEYVNGYIYANIWQSNYIVVIDPQSGNIIKSVDCSRLLTQRQKRQANVLNGIAFNAIDQTFLLTGKFWPLFFSVQF